MFTGLAEAGRGLSGVYIDFSKILKVGVDGLRVDDAVIMENSIQLRLKSMLAELKDPWDKSYKVSLRVAGINKGNYNLSINGSKPELVSDEELFNFSIIVLPDGKIVAGN